MAGVGQHRPPPVMAGEGRPSTDFLSYAASMAGRPRPRVGLWPAAGHDQGMPATSTPCGRWHYISCPVEPQLVPAIRPTRRHIRTKPVSTTPIDANTIDPPINAAAELPPDRGRLVQAMPRCASVSRAADRLRNHRPDASSCSVSPDLPGQLVAGLALVGGIVGEAVARHLIAPALRRRSYRRNELLHNEFTISTARRQHPNFHHQDRHHVNR